jgi:hypothetical protein
MSSRALDKREERATHTILLLELGVGRLGGETASDGGRGKASRGGDVAGTGDESSHGGLAALVRKGYGRLEGVVRGISESAAKAEGVF